MGCSVHEADVRKVHLSLTKLVLQFKTLSSPIFGKVLPAYIAAQGSKHEFFPLQFVMEKETWYAVS